MTLLSGNFSTRAHLKELYRKLCQGPSVRQEWRSRGARAGRLAYTDRYLSGKLNSAVVCVADIAQHRAEVSDKCVGTQDSDSLVYF